MMDFFTSKNHGKKPIPNTVFFSTGIEDSTMVLERDGYVTRKHHRCDNVNIDGGKHEQRSVY